MSVFTVRNENSQKKSVSIFGLSLGYGRVYDLMTLDGMTEDTIKDSLSNGTLKNKCLNGDLVIVDNTILFSSGDSAYTAFLKGLGLGPKIDPCDKLEFLLQTRWYIDPLHGKDTNKGDSPSKALLSHEELENRLGHYNTWNPIAGLVKVYIMGDLPATDQINLLSVLSRNTLIIYKAYQPVVISSGTITSMVDINPDSNQAYELRDSSKTNNFWADKVGKRIRITSGAALGDAKSLTAWVVKDLGNKTARISHWMAMYDEVWSYSGGSSPQVGDHYAIEALPKVNVGAIDLKGNAYQDLVYNDDGNHYPINALVFNDLEINDGGMYNDSGGLCLSFPGTVGFILNKCSLSQSIFIEHQNASFNGCINRTAMWIHTSSQTYMSWHTMLAGTLSDPQQFPDDPSEAWIELDAGALLSIDGGLFLQSHDVEARFFVRGAFYGNCNIALFDTGYTHFGPIGYLNQGTGGSGQVWGKNNKMPLIVQSGCLGHVENFRIVDAFATSGGTPCAELGIGYTYGTPFIGVDSFNDGLDTPLSPNYDGYNQATNKTTFALTTRRRADKVRLFDTLVENGGFLIQDSLFVFDFGTYHVKEGLITDGRDGAQFSWNLIELKLNP